MRCLGSRLLAGLSICVAGFVVVSFERSAAAAGTSLDGATSEQSASASDKYRAGAEALEAQKFPEALALVPRILRASCREPELALDDRANAREDG